LSPPFRIAAEWGLALLLGPAGQPSSAGSCPHLMVSDGACWNLCVPYVRPRRLFACLPWVDREQSPRASGPVLTAHRLTFLDMPSLLRSSKAGHGASREHDSSQQGLATCSRVARVRPVGRQHTPCKPGGIWLVDGSWQVTKEMPLLPSLTGPKAPGHTAPPPTATRRGPALGGAVPLRALEEG